MSAARASRNPSAIAGEPARTPSIYEVARVAGVSVATVSRVLNGKGPVRAATRQRVLAAVEQLDYVPHSAARSLSTRRTMSLGVLLPDMHGEFFSELVRGIDLAARAAGYHVLVSGSHSDPADTAALLQTLHGRVDGLILMTPAIGADWLRTALPRRLPVVLLNPSRELQANGDAASPARHDSLRIGNRLGARLAMDHLLALGHRHIAFLAGPAGNTDAVERLRGYREALADAGVAPEPELELEGDFSEASGLQAGHAFAALVPRPTAVFAANDAMAIGCLAALRERGLQVPGAVSLVGFDDIPISRYVMPPLTSVHVPIAELGTRAIERLLAAIDAKGAHERRQDTVATTLVVRGSTAPPQGPDRLTRPKGSKGETT
jgi:LacI family transcriptional regulator